MKKITNFFGDVKKEMQIVTWPTMPKLRKDVITVIESTLMYAVYFALVDGGIKFILKLFV